MTTRRGSTPGLLRGRWLLQIWVLAALTGPLTLTPAAAQLFSDRPPPVPPASVPAPGAAGRTGRAHPGRAVAVGALWQRHARDQWRAGVARVRRPSGRDRHLPDAARGSRPDPEHHAA